MVRRKQDSKKKNTPPRRQIAWARIKTDATAIVKIVWIVRGGLARTASFAIATATVWLIDDRAGMMVIAIALMLYGIRRDHQ